MPYIPQKPKLPPLSIPSVPSVQTPAIDVNARQPLAASSLATKPPTHAANLQPQPPPPPPPTATTATAHAAPPPQKKDPFAKALSMIPPAQHEGFLASKEMLRALAPKDYDSSYDEGVAHAFLICGSDEWKTVLEKSQKFLASYDFIMSPHELIMAIAQCPSTSRDCILETLSSFVDINEKQFHVRSLHEIVLALKDCPAEKFHEITALAKSLIKNSNNGVLLPQILNFFNACTNAEQRDAMLAFLRDYFHRFPKPIQKDFQMVLDSFVNRPMSVEENFGFETPTSGPLLLGSITTASRFLVLGRADMIADAIRALLCCPDRETQESLTSLALQFKSKYGYYHPCGAIMEALLACEPASRSEIANYALGFIDVYHLPKAILAFRDCKTDEARQSAVSRITKSMDPQQTIVDDLLAAGITQEDAAFYAMAITTPMTTPLTHDQRQKIRSAVTSDPKLAKILSQYMVPTTMEFKDGGLNHNHFSTFFAKLLPDVHVPSDAMVVGRLTSIPSVDQAAVDRDLPHGSKLVAVHGRTLLFEIDGDPEHYLAIKLAKEGENTSDVSSGLRREVWMNHALLSLQDALGLESDIPQPLEQSMVQVTLPEEIRKRVEAQAARFGSNEFDLATDMTTGKVIAIQSIVSKDYHVYLNDPALSPAAFRDSSDRCLKDYARQMRAGLFHSAPADLFHNTESDRRYVWDSEIVVKAGAYNRSNEGAGRLDRPAAAVQTPNHRASGVADTKHIYTTSQLLTDHPNAKYFKREDFSKSVFREVYEDKEREAKFSLDHAPQAAAITAMGDVLLSWALTTADSWAKRRAKGTPGNQLDLADELLHGFVTFYAQYTGLSRAETETLLGSLIDFKRMGRQFEYFNSDEYIREAQQPGGIPQERWVELYGPHTKVTWEMKEGMRGWTRAGGFRHNKKNIDLGPVNGPMPCQELMRALYVTTQLAMTHATQADAAA